VFLLSPGYPYDISKESNVIGDNGLLFSRKEEKSAISAGNQEIQNYAY
jgi:hypothetical protein